MLLQRFTPLALGFGLLAGTPALGATFTEYFNGYGDTQVAVDGLNGGTGDWNAWADPTSTSINSYKPGTQLTYTATGYSNTGNDAGLTDGAGVSWDQNTSVDETDNTINPREFQTGLTGTVWLSALIRFDEAGDDILFWLDNTASEYNSENRVGVLDGKLTIEYGGTSTTDTVVQAVNTTHLLLVKATVASGNDTVEFWFNPDLSAGEGGLGTANLSDNTADVFGDSLDGIAIFLRDADFSTSGANNGNNGGEIIDAIRISNDPNGFEFVTTGVPEPGSLVLLGVGAACLLGGRRRA